jgi:hypothetical protein
MKKRTKKITATPLATGQLALTTAMLFKCNVVLGGGGGGGDSSGRVDASLAKEEAY